MESLKTNTTISTLNIRNNQAGEEGGKHIIDCLKTNRAIFMLEHEDNEISQETSKLIDRYTINNKRSYPELAIFIRHNEQEIRQGAYGTLNNLKLYVDPYQEAERTPVIPLAIRSFLALLPKINAIHLGEYILEDLSLVNNLKLLIARNYFEISGICKKLEDDCPLTSFSKDLISQITYGLPIAFYAKLEEVSVEIAGHLEHTGDS